MGKYEFSADPVSAATCVEFVTTTYASRITITRKSKF